MNTSVTRGSATFVVTATGMETEVGHISDMLASADETDDPADAAAGQADPPAHRHRRRRAHRLHAPWPAAWRALRRALRGRHRLRGRGHPHRPAGRRHDHPLDGHAHAGRGRRHRQEPALGGDAGLDLGHQLGQDRHPDAQPDDRGRDGHGRPSLRDQRHRLRHHRQDPPRGR